MRIVIVDDDEAFARQTEGIIKKVFSQKEIQLESKVYTDGMYLVMDIDEGKNYDIYLLDIEMPQLSGLKVAERIRLWDNQAHIVFITSHEQYAVSGYKYRATDFILKEKYVEELPAVLESIIAEKAQDVTAYYLIKNFQKCERFAINDILYLKKENKNVVFYCRNGASYKERGTLEEILGKLPTSEFMYVNRGEVVNLRHVTGLKEGQISLYKVTLPISRGLLSQTRKTLLSYWEKI